MNSINIDIGGIKIGFGYPPYVIAEMSANHNGNIENAYKIIDAAKKSGASAIKIQTYRPDTITLNCQTEEFKISGGLWNGKTLYELYDEAHTPWEWHPQLFEYARKLGITIFSSPFDQSAVDFLESLNVPAYKIASFEAIDLPLIKYVASTGKPMIISTGMANQEEIQEALDTARTGGCKELAILHCVSGYPAPASDYNLRTLSDMINHYGVLTGLSDHTLGNVTAIAAVAMGAVIIEKHITLDRSQGGPDDSFSLEPPEMKDLCDDVMTAWHTLGEINYNYKSSEKSNVKFRRSLYFVKKLTAGELITAEAIRSVRPGFGIAPKHFDSLIGRKVSRDVNYGTPVTFDVLQ